MPIRLRRVLGLAAAASLFCLGGLSLAQPTDANWADSEHVSSRFSATTLQTPVITSCTVSTLLNLGLVFTGFVITWTSPYPKQGVQLKIDDIVIPPEYITQTGTGPYSYRAEFSATLLDALLGGLFGSTNPVVVRAVAGTNWTSPADTRTLRVGGLLGLVGPNNCTAP